MKISKIKSNETQTNTIEAQESEYLYIKPSQIKEAGNGLYTAITIYRNEIISIFTGEIINATEAEKRIQQELDRYFIVLLDGTILDSMHTNGFAKYANDALGSSFKNNAKITLDDDENVCLMATKKIKAGEEIFCSYGKSYWKKHG
ncbi:SET domain-containing protein-lysine N-methyltransferase [Lacinutrix chionoecetis]